MVAYVSREDVMSATDVSTIDTHRVDEAIEQATDAVNKLCQRVFYPTTETRTIQVNPDNRSLLRLGRNEATAIETIMDGDTEVTAYTLRDTDAPSNNHPYTKIDFDAAPSEDELDITGTFGFTDSTAYVTTLDGGINSSQVTMNVYSGARIGTGELYRIDDEWVRITERNFIDSTDDTDANLTADWSSQTINVTGINVGEVILIGAEQMLVQAVTDTSIIVQRAVNGSVLAAHTAPASVYVYRGCTIERAQLGSTAAAHTDNADIGRLAVPGKVKQLAKAYALDILAQEATGYARTAGTGDNERQVNTPALMRLENDVQKMYGRSTTRGA